MLKSRVLNFWIKSLYLSTNFHMKTSKKTPRNGTKPIHSLQIAKNGLKITKTTQGYKISRAIIYFFLA
jgi:hypothetical protein